MNFDQVINRTASESVKWRHFDADVLPMWVADMDFQAPQPVVDALQVRVSEGVFGYPGELDGLKDAIWPDWKSNTKESGCGSDRLSAGSG
jgi:cystathionine beta-lyase